MISYSSVTLEMEGQVEYIARWDTIFHTEMFGKCIRSSEDSLHLEKLHSVHSILNTAKVYCVIFWTSSLFVCGSVVVFSACAYMCVFVRNEMSASVRWREWRVQIPVSHDCSFMCCQTELILGLPIKGLFNSILMRGFCPCHFAYCVSNLHSSRIKISALG